MTAYGSPAQMDVAEKVFGTPERELRRRLLHPLGSTWSEMPESNGGEIKPPASQQQQQPGPSVATEDVTDSSEISPQSPPTVQDTPSPTEISSYTITSWADYIIGLLYHMTAVSFYIFIILDGDVVLKRMKEEEGIILPESDKYGGSWKYLTHINFSVQAGYFILALVCDLVPWIRKHLQKFLDFIFTTTAFPLAMVVSFLFWSLTLSLRVYVVGDPSGPGSKALEALPPYINHAWHSAVAFGVVIEILLVCHRYVSNSDAIKAMLIWNFSYTAWIYWCFYQAGTLPYPHLYLMGPYLMIFFFLLIFLVSVFFYFVGKTLTKWSWAV